MNMTKQITANCNEDYLGETGRRVKRTAVFKLLISL